MIEVIFTVVTLNLLFVIAILSHKLYILKEVVKHRENLYRDNDSIYTRPN